MNNWIFFGSLCAIFSQCIPGMSSSPIKQKSNQPCPANWLQYEGYCLLRPSLEPALVCQQLGAKSIFNLFCVKEITITKPITKPFCKPGWSEFQGHCLFVPKSDADTVCRLNGAVSVLGRICVTDLKTEDADKIATDFGIKENAHHREDSKEERACCPNGFGK